MDFMRKELQIIDGQSSRIKQITQEIKNDCNETLFKKATKKVAKLNAKGDGWEYLLFDNKKNNTFDIFRQNRNGAETVKIYKRI